MENEYYNNLYLLLSNQPLPNTLTPQQQQQLTKQSQHFVLRNNFIYKKDKRKENSLLRLIRKYELEPVLFMFHNDPTAAHFATDAMFEKIRTRYYWPQMYEDIRSYVRACDECQRRGRPRKNQMLHPIPVGSPFHQIGIDFVGPLPLTNQGNKYIIVAMDYLTKWPEAKPVSAATAEQVATFLYEDIIGRHGCPAKILSDRGTHFNNHMIAHLLERFRIKQLLSTPYHPQTNGLVERFNRTLCEALAKLSNEHKDDWDQYIAPVLFAYRTTRHNTTKMTPFYLVYGREAKLPMDDLTGLDANNENNIFARVNNLLEKLPLSRRIAKEQIASMQAKQKEIYDRKINREDHFRIGQKVLYYKASRDNQHTGKLLPKWEGPYYVHEICANGSYRIRNGNGKLLKSPVNGNLLKIYHEFQ
jgi:hypothetical protein